MYFILLLFITLIDGHRGFDMRPLSAIAFGLLCFDGYAPFRLHANLLNSKSQNFAIISTHPNSDGLGYSA